MSKFPTFIVCLISMELGGEHPGNNHSAYLSKVIAFVHTVSECLPIKKLSLHNSINSCFLSSKKTNKQKTRVYITIWIL